MTNSASGSINGGAAGISMIGTVAGTVTNFGSIEGTGTSGVAIQLRNGSTVTNGASATIIGQKEGVEIFGAGTVTNSGYILGSDPVNGLGVDLLGGGTVINYQGGSIYGAEGVYVRSVAGTVSNYGTIEGVGTSGHSDGVHLQEGGSVINGAGGLILGQAAGITSDLDVATVTNSGTIEHGIRHQPQASPRLVPSPTTRTRRLPAPTWPS